jgi:hypothetical protein
MADALERSEKTRFRRLPRRGSHEREQIYAILDEALVGHMGFTVDEQTYVIPTLSARLGDELYVHGSSASRALEAMSSGLRVCVTVTLIDGLVLARSAFNHSVNYRSVVVLGEAVAVEDDQEKAEVLKHFTERLISGRSEDVRGPNAKELRATRILRIPLEEASAKVRDGPPEDDEEDLGIDCWAGVMPLELRALPPHPAPDLRDGIAMPGYASNYKRA